MSVRLLPDAALGRNPHGFRFRRSDCRPSVDVPATLEHARSGPRRTCLWREAVRVSTVEHLLAALAGCGCWSCLVEIDGEEVPILDGSAAPWTELLRQAGISLHRPGGHAVVRRAFAQGRGRAHCRLEPAAEGSIECAIDFAHPAIGAQRVAWQIGDAEAFVREIAPARTFGFVDELEALHRQGLAFGADTSCVLAFDLQAPLSPLRFADEPVRHKLLDAIGDLALLGCPLQGKLLLECCSHRLLLSTLAAAVDSGAIEYD